MNGSGYFKVDRGVWSHALFTGEPYTPREAWLWLISEAAWKPRRVRVGKCMVSVDRGQIATSDRFLAEAWRWPKTRARRFLSKLKTEGMVSLRQGDGATILTVCNYAKYQVAGGIGTGENLDHQADHQISAGDVESGPPNGPLNAAPSICKTKEKVGVTLFSGPPNGPLGQELSGLEWTTKRTKREEGNNIKEMHSDADASASPRRKSLQRRDYTPEFETFWLAYPKTETANPKAEAFKVFDRLSPEDRAVAVASLPAFKAWVGRQFKGYHAPGAAVWLRQRRWERHAEELAAAPAANPAKVRAQLRVKAECHFRGEWRPGWGPSPGEPDCAIPEDVIAEAAHVMGAAWPQAFH
jgi:hypothetical protein